MTDGTRQMADFAREPSDSQIDGGLRIGSKRQAAGARRGRWGGGGGGVRGCRREQGGNVKEVPQASARVTFEPIFSRASDYIIPLVGIKLGIRCGPSVRTAIPCCAVPRTPLSNIRDHVEQCFSVDAWSPLYTANFQLLATETYPGPAYESRCVWPRFLLSGNRIPAVFLGKTMPYVHYPEHVLHSQRLRRK